MREATLKVKDLELALSRDLGSAKASLQAANIQPEEKKIEAGPQIDGLLTLAQISPRAAILEAWVKVEATGAAVVKRVVKDDLPRQLRSPVMFGEVLKNKNHIPTEVMNAILKLRDIRNRTAHTIEFQPSIEDAEEYVLLAGAVVADMETIE